MDSTQQPSISRHDDSKRQVWSLTVVFHPDSAIIGRRVIVDGTVSLGREHPVIESLADRKISRVHARVTLDGDTVSIEDAKSRNGTFVDGQQIEREALKHGSVIGIGSLLLLVHRTPAFFTPTRHPRVSAVGHAMAWILEEIGRAAKQQFPLSFYGETGTGKGLLAEEVHVQSERQGPFVTVQCGESAHLVPDLEAATGGTLFLDRLDEAPAALQSSLVAFLDGGRLGGKKLDVRLVASTFRDPSALATEGKLRDDLAARFAWAIEVPPLRERREDVMPMAMRMLAEIDPEATIHPELALALVRHDWPGNVHALRALLSRALMDAIDGELRLGPRVKKLLEKGSADPHEESESDSFERPSDASSGSARDVTTISRSGRWFEPAGKDRIPLETRRTLGALLEALVAAHERSKEETRSVSDLLAVGWPGERVLPRAGASRVYVAITSLRRMGLRDAIERTTTGYRIAPRARLRIVD